MSKTYEVYHNGEFVPATFIKQSAEIGRVWISYQHVEEDESGVKKPAYERTVHIEEADGILRVTETED